LVEIVDSRCLERHKEAVRDPESGQIRPCRAGDVALLAPAGTDLWHYEEVLEDSGIPVSTQAGKSFF
jgi:ATP-dependent exoDNAse (exonuclease V) beta subunit